MSQKMGTSVLYLHGTDFSNKKNHLSKGLHAPDENAASWQLMSEQSIWSHLVRLLIYRTYVR